MQLRTAGIAGARDAGHLLLDLHRFSLELRSFCEGALGGPFPALVADGTGQLRVARGADQVGDQPGGTAEAGSGGACSFRRRPPAVIGVDDEIGGRSERRRMGARGLREVHGQPDGRVVEDAAVDVGAPA